MCKPKWLDIATAPRDESWLLLYADIFGEPSVHAGFWSEGDWYDSEAASKPLRDIWAEPTHWQPLPAAPTSQPAGEARDAWCNTCGNQRLVIAPDATGWEPCPDCLPAEAPFTRHVIQNRIYLDEHGDYREETTVHTGPNTEAPATAPQSAMDDLGGLLADLSILDGMSARNQQVIFKAISAVTELRRLRASPAAAISEGERMSEARRNAYIRGFQRGHDAFLNNNSHEHVRALAEAYAISYAEQFDDSARLSPDKETAR
jgi:hypothetical protein